MKLLMFDVDEFWYKPFSKTIERAETFDGEGSVRGSLVIFINVEGEDEQRQDKVVKKAAEHICWLARKTDRNKVLLHSFAHLSDSKSSVDFAGSTIKAIEERLNAKGLDAGMTPFGYFLEFKIHVKGDSLAKVWKSI
jgi:hypothetical protein